MVSDYVTTLIAICSSFYQYMLNHTYIIFYSTIAPVNGYFKGNILVYPSLADFFA